MIGAALFYGDAVITPAISVLSAVEGIKLVTPALDDYVLTIASVIMIALFIVQSGGTDKVAAFFGPDHAGLVPDAGRGSASTYRRRSQHFRLDQPLLRPALLHDHGRRLSSPCSARSACRHRGRGALCRYGPFRPRPDPGAWLYLVFPSLWLNYLGQGALILVRPERHRQPVLPAGAGMGCCCRS
jgi:KUP system potassium uptake protein